MKYNKITLFVCSLLLLTSGPLLAQQNSVASGGDATGSGGSVSYSVGQTDYITATGSGGTATQGVQQPFEIFVVLSVEEVEDIQLIAKVFPNPTISDVTLVLSNRDLDGLFYHLLDMNGRLILKQKITEAETRVSMEALAAATYFLSVTDETGLLKTFKIIKH